MLSGAVVNLSSPVAPSCRVPGGEIPPRPPRWALRTPTAQPRGRPQGPACVHRACPAGPPFPHGPSSTPCWRVGWARPAVPPPLCSLVLPALRRVVQATSTGVSASGSSHTRYMWSLKPKRGMAHGEVGGGGRLRSLTLQVTNLSEPEFLVLCGKACEPGVGMAATRDTWGV